MKDRYLIPSFYLSLKMAAISPKIIRIGVYGPVKSGKSLFILRWCNPTLQMNEEDLAGNLFMNTYRTSSFVDNLELIEHPSDDKIDPTEDKHIIIANLLGWRDTYDHAMKVNPSGTFLVFTWKDKVGSGVLSNKIHETHEECSSYAGTGFEQFKTLVLNRKRNTNNARKKKRTVVDNEGWAKK